MTNFISNIFGSSTSALSAQQAIIAAAGNNIANVHTPGYARRELEILTRISGGNGTGLSLGNGVTVGDVTRINDAFLDTVARNAFSTQEFHQIQTDMLNRVEPLFGLTDGLNTIGNAITNFFSSLETLSLNPASIELRTDVLERGQDLVDAVRTTYNTIADLQSEVEDRIGSELGEVNSLTAQIATLNGQIQQRESGGKIAADERDQRSVLLEELAGKISYDIVEQSDGMVTISLSNGFPLVSGITSRDLEFTGTPSFAPVGGVPPKLDGTNTQYIVYDYDASASGSAHLDLTQTLASGQGVIGGLMALRGHTDVNASNAFENNGSLADVASRVEAMARDFLTRFNVAYRGPEATNDPTGNFDPSAVDLNGVNPGVFGFFNLGSGITADDDGDGTAEAADIDALVAAGTITNVSSLFTLAIANPEDIAAARDLADGADLLPGNADNLTNTSGTPPGLIALKTETTTFTSDSTSAFSRTDITYSEMYNETVGRVGTLQQRATSNLSVAEDNFISAKNKRDQVSGVSLDEEFSALIRAQKAFDASSKVFRTATEMLDVITGLI